MTDTMREAFEKWATGVGLSVAPYGASYLDEKTHIAWITWQAKQSAPVVGEVVAWLNECQLNLSHPVMSYVSINEPAPDRDWRITPLYKAPTNSISASELDRLQEGEACAETVLEAALVKFPDVPTEFECIGKMAAEVVRRYDAELERLRKDEELKASEASIACEALQEIIDLLPGSSVAQAKLIAVAAMTKRAAIAAEGEKE